MKKVLSLVLAFAMVFTMLVVPAAAEGNPTATAIVYMNEAPDANGVFYVGFGIKDVSSNIFVSGQMNWNWPAEVASLYDYDYGTAITNKSDAVDGYHITSWVDPYDGKRSGKYNKTCSSSTDLETGYTAVAITPYKAGLDAEAVPAGETLELFEVAYVLNEGASIDDFYIDLVSSRLNIDPTSDVNASTSDAGEVKLVSEVKPAAPAIEYTDANGITYKAVSDNLITIGMDAFTNAENGGALASWVVVDKSTVDATATEGQYIHRTGANTGGSGANTMRTFFPIEGGKTYYVTNSIYNNTGADIADSGNGADHGSAGMSAIVATSGGPVYGSFAGITQYSPVEYGGRTSWTNNDCTISGTNVTRTDMNLAVGYNKVEVLINAPAEATHIMISYGAHSNTTNEIYYGDFAIYEVEATEEIVDMVINYTDAEGNVVATETKTGAVGNTVDVVANTVVTGTDGAKYMVAADATLTFVSGGSTEAVTVAKVETVTISYTVGGVEVATGTVEGINGTDVAYSSGNVATATGVYAKAGTITVDNTNLTAVVELDAVAEGLVSSAGQDAAAVNTLDKQMTTAGTVTFDLTVLNIKDTLVALDNAAVIAASGNYFGDSSAYIQLKDGSFQVNDGSGLQALAAYELGKTYSVEFVLDVANYTYTATIMDGETEVAKVENFGMRNDVAPIDALVILDNAGAGAGAVVVSNLVVETEDEQPTDEPTSAPSEDEDEPTSAPSEDEDEPTSAPSEDEDEPTSAPSEDEDEPTSAPSEDEDEPTSAPSEDEDEPTSAPSEDEDEPTSAPSEDEDEPTSAPSEDEDEPTSAPSEDEDEPTSAPSEDEDEPTDEPSEEPGEELPFEAVDVNVETSALGVTISGKFVDEDTTYEKVVVVISYLKDGKAYSVQAVEVEVNENGEVEIPSSQVTLTEGELTVAGISLLVGVDALSAITTGNLGTPVGAWK